MCFSKKTSAEYWVTMAGLSVWLLWIWIVHSSRPAWLVFYIPQWIHQKARKYCNQAAELCCFRSSEARNDGGTKLGLISFVSTHTGMNHCAFLWKKNVSKAKMENELIWDPAQWVRRSGSWTLVQLQTTFKKLPIFGFCAQGNWVNISPTLWGTQQKLPRAYTAKSNHTKCGFQDRANDSEHISWEMACFVDTRIFKHFFFHCKRIS